MADVAVAALDVGSSKKLGWWITRTHGAHGGTTLVGLAKSLRRLSDDGVPVALGIEAPLWIPLPSEVETMGKARKAEPIAWSSSVGATVLAHGLQQLTWLLTQLDQELRIGLDVRSFLDGD